MSNQQKWINCQMRIGWVFLGAGLILVVIGIGLERSIRILSINPKIITGLGIFLLGMAIAYLVRYGSARRSLQAANRLASQELDERTQSIRARAGNRAYWFSAILTYALLMWISFAKNGGLPALSDDMLWYVLAGMVILPFGIYAGSIIYDEKHN